MLEPNTIVAGDCIELMNAGHIPQADLIFADPPFNIGYKYDVYEDRKAYDTYYKWTRDWIGACKNQLSPTGSLWIAIGDEYAAEVRTIATELGLHPRNWVIWHYTFGQNTKSKFARSHTHLLYFVNHRRNFTFNHQAVRVPSDRQTTYADKRANPMGKLPDDVWTEFPRVCGTFGEREGWHPCQMPEMILARIIRACSNPDDLVFDPFSGSGTTLVVAKKLRRRYFGTDVSKDYVKRIKRRLADTEALSGIKGEGLSPWPEQHIEELKAAYREARVPTDQLHKDTHLLWSLCEQFNARLAASTGEIDAYTPEQIWDRLEKLRKGGKLGKIRVFAEESAKLDIRPVNEKMLFDK